MTPCAVLLGLSLYDTWACQGKVQGSKERRGCRVECKGWNLTIDFLAGVLRWEDMRRVRMGSFQLLGILLIYSSLLSHVTLTGKLIYDK